VAARTSTFSWQSTLIESSSLIIMEAWTAHLLTDGLSNWLLAMIVYVNVHWVYSGSSKPVSVVVQIHPRNIEQSRNHLWSSWTVWLIQLVLPGKLRCSYIPLEITTVLPDTGRAFSSKLKITCSCGGEFKLIQYSTFTIANHWSSWHHCRGVWGSSKVV